VAASKKRASKDQDPTKPKQKRTNPKTAADSNLDADPYSPTSAQDSSESTAKKDEVKRSIVSTMSLDGHGQQ